MAVIRRPLGKKGLDMALLVALGRRWVAVFALALVAAGCADEEPQPEFKPSAESSATGSATPSARPTTQPWEKKTEAGAVAFAKHWVKMLNASGISGDVTALEESSSEGCASCRNLISYVESVYRDGGHIESGGWRVQEVAVAPGAKARRIDVTLRVRQSAQRIYRPGKKVARVEPTMFTVSMGVTWDRRWIAERMEVIE